MLKTTGVKFNENGKVYYFEFFEGLNKGDNVVVDTDNGHELAIVAYPEKQIQDDKIDGQLSKILRVATDKDIEKIQTLRANKKEVIAKATELVNKYKLDMKIVDVDYTLDSSKTTIFFVCEDRVDFRDLVKDLAGMLKTRVELRQIGVRDHAKRIGGIGACGKECCCSQYLNDFDKVSVKMAKTQNLSLNPTKISGTCGRLMCCLAFENDYYAKVSEKMPKINSYVSTPKGNGVVVYNDLLKEMVSVKREVGDGVVIDTFAPNEVKVLQGKAHEKK